VREGGSRGRGGGGGGGDPRTALAVSRVGRLVGRGVDGIHSFDVHDLEGLCPGGPAGNGVPSSGSDGVPQQELVGVGASVGDVYYQYLGRWETRPRRHKARHVIAASGRAPKVRFGVGVGHGGLGNVNVAEVFVGKMHRGAARPRSCTGGPAVEAVRLSGRPK